LCPRGTLMINKDKLKVFAFYKGDLDMWLRTGKDREKKFMKSEDWHLIDLLLQDATVINRQLGSPSRTAEAAKRLSENTESEEVISEIMRLAEKL
jgi:molybdate-binding protein